MRAGFGLALVAERAPEPGLRLPPGRLPRPALTVNDV